MKDANEPIANAPSLLRGESTTRSAKYTIAPTVGVPVLLHELSVTESDDSMTINSKAVTALVQASAWYWLAMLAVFCVAGTALLRWGDPLMGWATLGIGIFTTFIGWAMSQMERFNPISPRQQSVILPREPILYLKQSKQPPNDALLLIRPVRVVAIEYAIDRYRPPSSRVWQVQVEHGTDEPTLLFIADWSPLDVLRRVCATWRNQLASMRVRQRDYPSQGDMRRLNQEATAQPRLTFEYGASSQPGKEKNTTLMVYDFRQAMAKAGNTPTSAPSPPA